MLQKLPLSLLLALVAWLGISLGPGMSAAEASCITITVTPANPTEADAIEITVAGPLPNPCFDITSSHTVDGAFIDVTVQATPWEGYCIDVVSDFSATEAIGQLPAGEYLVQATVHIPCCFPCNPPPCIEFTTFQVEAPGQGQPSPLDSDDDSFDGVTLHLQDPGAAVDASCPTGMLPVWADCVESYLGTDPLDSCNNGSEVVDAWPPDMNMDRSVNVLDVFPMFSGWVQPVEPPPAVDAGRRYDLNADGWINVLDVFLTFPPWLNTCT
jgi:hypothetical protein